MGMIGTGNDPISTPDPSAQRSTILDSGAIAGIVTPSAPRSN